MRGLIAIVSVCVVVTFAAGCASTPASRFYTLSATTTSGATSSDVSIAVGPVSVPAVVDRPQIVVTTGPNQVRLEEFNRWAAPLQNSIARVVAENVVAMLGTRRVALAQCVGAGAACGGVIGVRRVESERGEAA